MWLIISVIGYFLNSVALLIDRALLSKAIPNPVAYTFYITALGMIALVVVPFGVTFPPASLLLCSIASGVFFTGALFTMFTALKEGEATEISPFIGGIQPIFVFLLSLILLNETLTKTQYMGFLVVLIAGILIAIHKPKCGRKVYLVALLSTIFYAFSYVLVKYVFDAPFFTAGNIGFVNGFFWSRFGAFAASCLFLLSPVFRKQIIPQKNEGEKKSGVFFLIGQFSGAFSFILVTYAISLASVTLVNSLQGLQYALLFAMIYPLSRTYPKLWPETWSKKVLLNKVISILLIGVGLFLIAQ